MTRQLKDLMQVELEMTKQLKYLGQGNCYITTIGSVVLLLLVVRSHIGLKWDESSGSSLISYWTYIFDLIECSLMSLWTFVGELFERQ